MANLLREVLNASGMSLGIYCAGQSKVGINVSGTWTGTIPFSASTDGLNFIPLSVTPFASGPTVQSTTANGSWEVLVQNYLVVKCGKAPVGGVTIASGSAVVVMGSSIDASYQDAFLASTSKYVSQSVGGGATNVVTINAQTNRAWRLRTLSIGYSAAAAGSVDLKVSDGASAVLWEGYVPPSLNGVSGGGTWLAPLPPDDGNPGIVSGGVVGTPGNSLIITLAAPGGSVVSTVNAEIYSA